MLLGYPPNSRNLAKNVKSGGFRRTAILFSILCAILAQQGLDNRMIFFLIELQSHPVSEVTP